MATHYEALPAIQKLRECLQTQVKKHHGTLAPCRAQLHLTARDSPQGWTQGDRLGTPWLWTQQPSGFVPLWLIPLGLLNGIVWPCVHCSYSSVSELSQGQGNHLKQASPSRDVVPQNAGQWDENPTILSIVERGTQVTPCIHWQPRWLQQASSLHWWLSHSEHLGTGDQGHCYLQGKLL